MIHKAGTKVICSYRNRPLGGGESTPWIGTIVEPSRDERPDGRPSDFALCISLRRSMVKYEFGVRMDTDKDLQEVQNDQNQDA